MALRVVSVLIVVSLAGCMSAVPVEVDDQDQPPADGFSMFPYPPHWCGEGFGLHDSDQLDSLAESHEWLLFGAPSLDAAGECRPGMAAGYPEANRSVGFLIEDETGLFNIQSAWWNDEYGILAGSVARGGAQSTAAYGIYKEGTFTLHEPADLQVWNPVQAIDAGQGPLILAGSRLALGQHLLHQEDGTWVAAPFPGSDLVMGAASLTRYGEGVAVSGVLSTGEIALWHFDGSGAFSRVEAIAQAPDQVDSIWTWAAGGHEEPPAVAWLDFIGVHTVHVTHNVDGEWITVDTGSTSTGTLAGGNGTFVWKSVDSGGAPPVASYYVIRNGTSYKCSEPEHRGPLISYPDGPYVLAEVGGTEQEPLLAAVPFRCLQPA